MRNHPLNSPEAAGRILALVLIADGHVCRSEIDALNRLHAETALGLPAGGLADIVRILCEDLMHGLCTTGALLDGLDRDTVDSFFAEVSSPLLRQQVLLLARAAVDADAHLSEGEVLVLEAAERCWGLQARTQQPTEALLVA